MWALTAIDSAATVAVEAEDSDADIFREAIMFKPMVDRHSGTFPKSTDSLSVLRSIIVRMIYRQEGRCCFPTAGAGFTVLSKDLSLQELVRSQPIVVFPLGKARLTIKDHLHLPLSQLFGSPLTPFNTSGLVPRLCFLSNRHLMQLVVTLGIVTLSSFVLFMRHRLGLSLFPNFYRRQTNLSPAALSKLWVTAKPLPVARVNLISLRRLVTLVSLVPDFTLLMICHPTYYSMIGGVRQGIMSVISHV